MKSEQEWEIELQDVLEELRKSSAGSVYLGFRRLDANGAKVLASALKENRSLRSLNLNLHNIGDEGAVALAEALKQNCCLKDISLYLSGIGDEGAVALAEALKKNRSLGTLVLTLNNIGAEGAAALAEALKENHSLLFMNLDLNYCISAEQKEIIKKYLDHNIALCEQLHRAVHSGDLKKTQEYIQRGVGLLSVAGEEENTPLHWAAAKGYIDIVKLLVTKMIEQKLNLTVKNKDGKTPLDLAQKNAHKQVIQLLQEAIANPKTILNEEKSVIEKVSLENLQPPINVQTIQVTNLSKDISSSETERYIQRGEKFLANKKYFEALQCFEEALHLQPEHAEALFRKGTALRNLPSRLDEAKQVFEKIIAIEDKNAEEYQQLARQDLQKIEKEQALLQGQSISSIASPSTENIISKSTEREELLGRVSSKAELRKPNIQSNTAVKQTKIISSSAATPLSQNPARVQFSLSTTPQANSSKQNENDSKEQLSKIVEEKASIKILQ